MKVLIVQAEEDMRRLHDDAADEAAAGGSVRRLISLTGGHSMKTGLIILFMTPTPPPLGI